MCPVIDKIFFVLLIRKTGYNLGDSAMRLNVLKPQTNYLKRSFCYSGALLWNSLPQEIRINLKKQ